MFYIDYPIFILNYKQVEFRRENSNEISYVGVFPSICSKIKIPHLIIQGEIDDTVLPQDAEDLHSWNPKSELIMIEEMNHSLGSEQPWNETKMPIHLEEVVKISIDFIRDK